MEVSSWENHLEMGHIYHVYVKLPEGKWWFSHILPMKKRRPVSGPQNWTAEPGGGRKAERKAPRSEIVGKSYGKIHVKKC